MKRAGKLVVGLAAIVALLYGVGPLWAGWHLRQAMKSRDLAVLQERVDWVQLRHNLKPRIAAAIRDDAEKSGTLSGLIKRKVGVTLADAAVETFVTPVNLSRVLAGRSFMIERLPGASVPPPGAPDFEDADDPMPPRRIRWAFFDSLTRFRVEATHPKLPNSRIVSILGLDGFAWKLVDVDIVKR